MADLRVRILEGRALETVRTRVAPLGLRFWDPVTGGYITDGLKVTAFPEGHERLRAEATTNPSGISTFHHLAGLAGFEHAWKHSAKQPSTVDDAFWSDPELGADKRAFIVQVDDSMGRFLPLELRVEVPVRDIFKWPVPAGSEFPAGPGEAIPLFTSPTRKAQTGVAVIRADLYVPSATATDAAKPAAWAIARALLGTKTLAWGASDEKGRLTLLFPYPEASSGVGPTPPPLSSRTWNVTLSVRFDVPAAGKEIAKRAVLPGVLQQSSKALRSKWGATAADRPALGPVVLHYGEELIVNSEDGQGRVWIA